MSKRNKSAAPTPETVDIEEVIAATAAPDAATPPDAPAEATSAADRYIATKAFACFVNGSLKRFKAGQDVTEFAAPLIAGRCPVEKA